MKIVTFSKSSFGCKFVLVWVIGSHFKISHYFLCCIGTGFWTGHYNWSVVQFSPHLHNVKATLLSQILMSLLQ